MTTLSFDVLYVEQEVVIIDKAVVVDLVREPQRVIVPCQAYAVAVGGTSHTLNVCKFDCCRARAAVKGD